MTYPDDTPQDDTDNPRRVYHYEQPDLPHALTGITDANGARYATYGYDACGRAILSEHTGGAERVRLTYNADGTTTVSDALGAVRTYRFRTVHGVAKPVAIGGYLCRGCGTQAQRTTYDANCNRIATTDPLERSSTSDFDALDRLIRQIDAYGGETRYTYDAHDRLTGVTDPRGLTTRYRYDGLGNRLEQHSPDRDPDGDGHKINIALRFLGQYKDGESGLHYN